MLIKTTSISLFIHLTWRLMDQSESFLQYQLRIKVMKCNIEMVLEMLLPFTLVSVID